MTNRVQVVVEAKDAASGVMRAITSEFGALGGLVEELTAKNISWGNVTQMATKLVIDGMRESVRATVEYAGQVRELSLISGQGAEETSRFIQVLDDYGITADDALTATRALTNEGHAPSIDTLARLSDQYLSLNTVQDKNAFILKNLGRGGMEWITVLNQGSTAIRAQGAAVSDSLILTEQAVQQAREYELALDSWDDSVQALKVSIGSQLLPVLTDMLNNIADADAAMRAATEAGLNWQNMTFPEQQMWVQKAAAARQATQAIKDNTTANDENILSMEEQKRAAEALSKEFQTLLSMTAQLSSEEDSYNKKMADLTKEIESVGKQISQAQAEFGATSPQVAELQTKYNDLGQQMQETADEHTQATNQIIYNNLMSKLSIDGLTQAEFNMAQQAGVSLGLFTQAQADQAAAINDLTTQLANGQITIEQFNQAIADGSYVVGDANATVEQSATDMAGAVTTSSADVAGASEEMAQSVTAMSETSAGALDASADSWYQYKLDIVAVLNGLIQKTRDYIAVLNDIPTEINTTVTQTDTTAGTGVAPQQTFGGGRGAAPGGGGSTFNQFFGAYVNLQNNVNGSDFLGYR